MNIYLLIIFCSIIFPLAANAQDRSASVETSRKYIQCLQNNIGKFKANKALADDVADRLEIICNQEGAAYAQNYVDWLETSDLPPADRSAARPKVEAYAAKLQHDMAFDIVRLSRDPAPTDLRVLRTSRRTPEPSSGNSSPSH